MHVCHVHQLGKTAKMEINIKVLGKFPLLTAKLPVLL